MLRELEYEEELALFNLKNKLTEEEYFQVMELYTMYRYSVGYIEGLKEGLVSKNNSISSPWTITSSTSTPIKY